MKLRLRLLAVGAVALSLSACSKSESPPPAATAPVAPMASAAPVASTAPVAAALPPLHIGYSDWPGFVAWEIALNKGWFKEAGVDVEFSYFEYVPSMDAYSAGKIDAVGLTNGDQLVIGSKGSKSVAIIVNDYSDGNDMIVAKPGITKIEQLKGKKIGVEVGFVDHLLLLYALKAANLTEHDVKLVNVPTDQTPQTLKAAGVDAVGCWQPSSGTALKEVPGSTPIFTSSNVPGLIYDMLAVNPKSLSERHADWLKVTKVWGKVANYVTDAKNADEVAKIMGARVGLSAEVFKPLLKGTHIMTLEEAKKHLVKAEGLDSIYGSDKIVDEFNVKNAVYSAPVPADEYLNPSFTDEALQ
jgi:NitT/TauT family transport system substrate-binding protein